MKRLTVSFFAWLLLIAVTVIRPAFGVPAIPQGASLKVASAIIMDLDTDAILFEQNPDARIPPASLTKVMSMLLARDFIAQGQAKYSSPVSISPQAASVGGSRMGLKKGQTVSFEKLLLGMAVSSGNDASHAVAEYVGGTTGSFVRQMNVRARELGMKDTVFRNPHGLPADGQYTTARDMLTLARAYLKKYPNALKMHNTTLLTHNGSTTWNKNPLLGQYPGADGLKSGWIRASGYNLIFTASNGKRRLLAVILGAPDSSTRAAEACRLLDAGFLVCSNPSMTMAQALDTLPFDGGRIELQKVAREAGLLTPISKTVATKTTRKAPVKKSSGKRIAAKSTRQSSKKVTKSTAKKSSGKTSVTTKSTAGKKKTGASSQVASKKSAAPQKSAKAGAKSNAAKNSGGKKPAARRSAARQTRQTAAKKSGKAS